MESDGGVDGRHTVVLRDDVGVVRVAHVHHPHAGIVVDEVIDLFRTHQEGRNHHPLVDMLRLAVDDALADEGQHTVGKHLGVDTQIPVVAQLGQYGIGDRTDTHLQRRSVFDQRGAVPADGLLRFARLGEFRFDQRLIILHEHVDFRHRNDGIAERPGNILVHDGDDDLGGLYGSQRGIDRRTERHITVLVGRTNLNHRHIARHGAATIQALRLREEDRNIIGIAALRHLTDVAAHEKRIELENPFELGIGVRCRAFGVEMVHMHMLQLAGLAARAHRLDQTLRCRRNRTQMDMVARFDDLHGLFSRCEFDRSIHYFPSFLNEIKLGFFSVLSAIGRSRSICVLLRPVRTPRRYRLRAHR